VQSHDSIQSYEDLVEKALSHLENRESRELEDFLADLHSVELAGVLNSLGLDDQQQMLKFITGLDQLSELLAYSGEQVCNLVLKLIDDSRIAAVTRRMDIDDAARVLSLLSRRRQVKVLKRLSPVRVKEIKSILSHEQETAGRIMTTRYWSFSGDTKVKDALAKLRNELADGSIDDETDLHYAYVLNDHNEILGVFSLRQLLAAEDEQPLSSIMTMEILSIEADDDQEMAARLIADYDISAIPVVSNENQEMIGIITIDDVLDVIEEEATEDILRLAGTEDSDTVGASLFVALRGRLPWLIASCCGGIAGAMLLGNFSNTLEKMVALAFFMPVVFGMGGNVGSQASTITVRGLATGELSSHKTLSRLQKEALVGLFLGVSFACILFIASFLIFGELKLSVIVATSITVTMICAATLGSMLPVAFHKLGIDPAVASGPLVTTSSDILSIVIYFSVASAFL
jgi:magnesium transporter